MNQPVPENISLAEFILWEQRQSDRFEWIDGIIVRCAGGTYEHATIISNLHVLCNTALADRTCFVQGSDRKLIPRSAQGVDLGSFYADLFVSCSDEDRKGDAAHYPTIVIEVLSSHVGTEFTRKRDAYLRSAEIVDYFIIDSLRRAVMRFGRREIDGKRHIVTAEYLHGPVPVPALGLSIAFQQIYAGTEVPAVLHEISEDVDENEVPIQFD